MSDRTTVEPTNLDASPQEEATEAVMGTSSTEQRTNSTEQRTNSTEQRTNSTEQRTNSTEQRTKAASRRRLLGLLGLGGVSVLGLAYRGRHRIQGMLRGGSKSAAKEVAVGSPAPHFALPRISGEETFRFDGELERPLLVKVFASWCQGCRKASAYDDPKEARESGRLDAVAISIDETIDLAREAAETWPVKFPVLFDQEGAFAQAYGIEHLPRYILIGTDGIVRRISAMPNKKDMAAWLAIK